MMKTQLEMQYKHVTVIGLLTKLSEDGKAIISTESGIVTVDYQPSNPPRDGLVWASVAVVNGSPMLINCKPF